MTDPEEGAVKPSENGEAGDNNTAGAESGEGSLVLGFLVIFAVFYFAGAWSRLPEGTGWRLLITAGVAIVLFVAWYFVKAQLAEKLRTPIRKWSIVASDFLTFLVVVVSVIVASIVLDPDNQVLLLKLFAVLYLQFSSRKTLAVWKGVRPQPLQAEGRRSRQPPATADVVAVLPGMEDGTRPRLR